MSPHITNEFVKIATLESLVEAQVVESILTEQHIPHRIRSFHDTAYDGLFQLQKGWGDLYAPASYESEITEILTGIRTQSTSPEP
ncbi:MAG: hypothetical protein ABF303_04915 [Desulfobacterales bacterium]|jgi:hypothetical protein